MVVIDSSSGDGSAELARSRGARVEVIGQAEFRHGAARNLGAELARGETLVFTSQDADPVDDRWLATLCHPLAENANAAAVYGRQLPHDNARPPERYFLDFLYGPTARTQTARATSELSMDATLFSNVNSAIRRSVWDGFRFADDIIMSEDQEWSAGPCSPAGSCCTSHEPQCGTRTSTPSARPSPASSTRACRRSARTSLASARRRACSDAQRAATASARSSGSGGRVSAAGSRTQPCTRRRSFSAWNRSSPPAAADLAQAARQRQPPVLVWSQ